jgi:hypothetical protein
MVVMRRNLLHLAHPDRPGLEQIQPIVSWLFRFVFAGNIITR